MNLPIRVDVKTGQRKTVELTRSMLIVLLNDQFDLDLPGDTRVSVRVPGGGDWSNCDLELDESCGLNVGWTETQQYNTQIKGEQ